MLQEWHMRTLQLKSGNACVVHKSHLPTSDAILSPTFTRCTTVLFFLKEKLQCFCFLFFFAVSPSTELWNMRTMRKQEKTFSEGTDA